MQEAIRLREGGSAPILTTQRAVLGAIALAAAAGLMVVATEGGVLYVGAMILGLLFVAAVFIEPIFGVLALLASILLGLPDFLQGTGRLTPNNVLGLLLLVLLAGRLYVTRDFWFLRTRQVIILFAIGVLLVSSLVHSWYNYVPAVPLSKDFTENTLFNFFSRFALLIMLVNFVKTGRQMLAVLLTIFVLTLAAIPSAYSNWMEYREGVVETGEGRTVNMYTGKAEEFRISSEIASWAKNENRLAFMCNIGILATWMVAQLWPWAIVRVPAALVLGTLVTLVLATGSRSGFLSLGLVFVFLMFQRNVARFRWGVLVALTCAAVVLLAVLPQQTIQRLSNYSLDQTERPEGWRSTQSRIETNEHALQIALQAPFLGVGPGNFRWVHRERFPYTLAAGRPTHNSYMWAATEGGVFVLALYGLLLFVIGRDLVLAHRRYAFEDPRWHLTRFLKGYLIVFLFFSVFADFWLEPHLYVLAGFSMLLRRFAEDEGAGEAPGLAAA